jgi:hypothetical protein
MCHHRLAFMSDIVNFSDRATAYLSLFSTLSSTIIIIFLWALHQRHPAMTMSTITPLFDSAKWYWSQSWVSMLHCINRNIFFMLTGSFMNIHQRWAPYIWLADRTQPNCSQTSLRILIRIVGSLQMTDIPTTDHYVISSL